MVLMHKRLKIKTLNRNHFWPIGCYSSKVMNPTTQLQESRLRLMISETHW